MLPIRACVLVLSLVCALPLAATRPAFAGPATDRPAPTLDEELPSVELYTIGQGVILFEKFGHAVLCLRYPSNPRRDTCYNYGTADFGAPISLGWGFFRGEDVFWLGPSTPQRMFRFYHGEDRSMWRQVLPLSPDQVRALIAKLNHDSDPAHRNFRYEFFTENCTTKLRDILDEVTGGKLRENSSASTGVTFRDLARQGLADDTIVLLASDFVLSRSTDQPISQWDMMFLPSYFATEIEKRFGVAPELVYQRRGPPVGSDPGWGGRGYLLLFILLFSVPALAGRLLRRYEKGTLRLALVPLSLFGLVVWFMSAICPMPELRINEALLVFLPIDLVLFKRTAWRQRYAQARLGMLVVVTLLLAIGVFEQPLWIPMLIAYFPILALALPDHIGAAQHEHEEPAANKPLAPARPPGKAKQSKPRKRR
ncbi:MAG TPA: DUF4105 domain-containing protein [Kofleriaceae bacterium]|nr:DUF4105 domain-containing protein [Kofleriaceae bacterium]